MKANILALVIIAVIFGLAVSESLGQTQYVPAVNLITEKEGIGGEHAPLVWTGTEYLAKNDATEQVTDWIKIGSSFYDTNLENRVTTIFNPQFFTLEINLAVHGGAAAGADGLIYGAGDSSTLAAARFEIADSSAAVIPFWNADSSNLFIADGNYTHSQYGTWRFEDIPKTLATTADDKGWLYPIRVLRGSYIRFVFTGRADGGDDTTLVKWKLVGEN